MNHPDIGGYVHAMLEKTTHARNMARTTTSLQTPNRSSRMGCLLSAATNEAFYWNKAGSNREETGCTLSPPIIDTDHRPPPV